MTEPKNQLQAPHMKNELRSFIHLCGLRAIRLAIPAIFMVHAVLPPSGNASIVMDRQYSLESIGVLKSADNSDGVMAEPVSNAYRDYFAHQSRFVLSDLSKADSILQDSKIPYARVVEDLEVLGQVSRSTQSDSLLRTRVTQRNQQYFFLMEWLHSPQMELIAREEFEFGESEEGHAPSMESNVAPNVAMDTKKLSAALRTHLEKLFARIPFSGRVTGRDQATVTINLGTEDDRVGPGDILTLGTIEEVKKHPLLKQIVEWKTAPTGKVVVEQVDQNMAFCKIVEEAPGKEISRYQKMLAVERVGSHLSAHSEPSVSSGHPNAFGSSSQAELTERKNTDLGWLSAGVTSGTFSRDFSNGTTSHSGGGLALGGKIEGQLWLTRNWFAEAELRYGFWGYAQKDLSTGINSPVTTNGGVSGSLNDFNFNVGYSHLLTPSFFGPKAWLKLGYRATSFSFPVSLTENTGPASFGSLALGVGGHLPLRNGWGFTTNAHFGLISSVAQEWVTLPPLGASYFSFMIGGDYRISQNLQVRAALEYASWGANYSSGTSLSQKTVTIAPTLLYYF